MNKGREIGGRIRKGQEMKKWRKDGDRSGSQLKGRSIFHRVLSHNISVPFISDLADRHYQSMNRFGGASVRHVAAPLSSPPTYVSTASIYKEIE